MTEQFQTMPNPGQPEGKHRVIVVYATTFGATERVAEQVASRLHHQLGQDVPCRDIAYLDLSVVPDYDLVVLGLATWNIGQLPFDIETRLDELASLDLTGRFIAMFGTGDALGYPDTFLDALHLVYEALQPTGVTLVGSWPVDGYRFTASLAQHGEEFIGLGLDEDNESELTEARINAWIPKMLTEYYRAARNVRFKAPAAG